MIHWTPTPEQNRLRLEIAQWDEVEKIVRREAKRAGVPVPHLTIHAIWEERRKLRELWWKEDRQVDDGLGNPHRPPPQPG